jgi:uncharacterized protein
VTGVGSGKTAGCSPVTKIRKPRGATKTGKIEPSMPIPKELLEILVCPVCKADLELKPDESGLKCTKCKRVYPVRDNIPVMLVDQATVEA